jgi:hypothetical protein
MPFQRAILGPLCLGLLSIVGGPAWPEQTDTLKAQPQTKRTEWLHNVYVEEASAYKYFLDADRRHGLELRREPVMRWTSTGDYNGEVYVWTHEGAAKVVGCIFSGPRGAGARAIMHEFHTLAPGPLYSDQRGGSGWLPQEPGAMFEALLGAPEPATTRALRLTQMRDLARRFAAQVERDGSKWQMRLLSQPIYRYEITDEKSTIVDGAVFAFVWTAGTDPEALVVIEARRRDQGVRWYYAPARFTNEKAWLQYEGKEVWRADAATVGIFDGVTTKRYGAFQVKEISARSSP